MNHKKFFLLLIALLLIISYVTPAYAEIYNWSESEWNAEIPESELWRIYYDSYKLFYASRVSGRLFVDENAQAVTLERNGHDVTYQPGKGEYFDVQYWENLAKALYVDEIYGYALDPGKGFDEELGIMKVIDGNMYFLQDINDIALIYLGNEGRTGDQITDYMYGDFDDKAKYYGTYVGLSIGGYKYSFIRCGDRSFPQCLENIHNIENGLTPMELSDEDVTDGIAEGRFFYGRTLFRSSSTVDLIKVGDTWKIAGGTITSIFAPGYDRTEVSYDSLFGCIYSQIAKTVAEEYISEKIV